jgi:hypothetical protein
MHQTISISMNNKMASLKKVLTDPTYKRNILRQVEYKCKLANFKPYLARIVEIEDKPFDYSLDSDNDDYDIDEDIQRFGDDFEVTELVRYEYDIERALKLYAKHINYDVTDDKKSITGMYFDCSKKDFSVMVADNKYSSGWLYVVHIVMLVDDDVIDYTNINHSIEKHYKNEQHILGINGENVKMCTL